MIISVYFEVPDHAGSNIKKKSVMTISVTFCLFAFPVTSMFPSQSLDRTTLFC